MPGKGKLLAYTLPMALFLGLLALGIGLKKIGGGFWLSSPEYWIYPAQTLLCGAVLFWFRQDYDFGRVRQPAFVLGIGVFAFVLWISPQVILGFPPRTTGFNPELFAANPSAYWLTVSFRFLRLVVVVPLVEEIFWRGFLLRYLINERFYNVPFGAFSWLSFGVVSVAFGFAHSAPDWVVAIITGAIYNFVAYRTKSLISCVIVHAVTNLLLGLWIMSTQQWGFW
jgi:CAAX prenyl protease-like protein